MKNIADIFKIIEVKTSNNLLDSFQFSYPNLLAVNHESIFISSKTVCPAVLLKLGKCYKCSIFAAGIIFAIPSAHSKAFLIGDVYGSLTQRIAVAVRRAGQGSCTHTADE